MGTSIMDFTIKADSKTDIEIIDVMLSKMTGMFCDYSFNRNEEEINVHDDGMSYDYLVKCINGINSLLCQNDISVTFTVNGNIDYDDGNYRLFRIDYDNGAVTSKEIDFEVEDLFDEDSYDDALFEAEKLLEEEQSFGVDLNMYGNPMNQDDAEQALMDYLKIHAKTGDTNKERTEKKEEVIDESLTLEEMLKIATKIRPEMEKIGIADSEKLDDMDEAYSAMQNPREYELLLQAENVLPNAEKVPKKLSHEKAFSVCPRTKLFAEMGDELAKKILNNYYKCFGNYPWE